MYFRSKVLNKFSIDTIYLGCSFREDKTVWMDAQMSGRILLK